MYSEVKTTRYESNIYFVSLPNAGAAGAELHLYIYNPIIKNVTHPSSRIFVKYNLGRVLSDNLNFNPLSLYYITKLFSSIFIK